MVVNGESFWFDEIESIDVEVVFENSPYPRVAFYASALAFAIGWGDPFIMAFVAIGAFWEWQDFPRMAVLINEKVVASSVKSDPIFEFHRLLLKVNLLYVTRLHQNISYEKSHHHHHGHRPARTHRVGHIRIHRTHPGRYDQ